MKRKTLRRKRQLRKTRKRKGGKDIGSGAYATVYAPGMLCNEIPAEVTKVYDVKRKKISDGMAKNMIAQVKLISAKLKEIDPNQESFLYPEFCDKTPTLSDENKKDGLTEHDIAFSYNMKLADMSLAQKYETEIERSSFIVNDILYTEDQEHDNPPNVIREKTGTHRKEAEKLVETFIPIFKKIKPLVEKLHGARILHNDLTAQNVVVMKDGTYRLIDFDMSRISETPLEPNQKNGDIRKFNISFVLGWDEVYPDLYRRVVTAA